MSTNPATEQSLFTGRMLSAHAELSKSEPTFAYRWFHLAYESASTIDERAEALIMTSEALRKAGLIYAANDYAEQALELTKSPSCNRFLSVASLVVAGQATHARALHAKHTRDDDDDIAFSKRESPELLRQADKQLERCFKKLDILLPNQEEGSARQMMLLATAQVAHGLLTYDLSRQPARRKRDGTTEPLSRHQKQNLRRSALSLLRESILVLERHQLQTTEFVRLRYEALLAIIQCCPLLERAEYMDEAYTLCQQLGRKAAEVRRAFAGRRWVIRHQVKQIIHANRSDEIGED